MNEILETLVRLMAPMLSFTADEIWQYMGGKDRSASVHMDLFVPVNDSYRDSELAERWETIIAIRKEATKALELARKERADFIFLSTSRVYPYGRINSLKLRERKTRFYWAGEGKCPGFSANGISEEFSLAGARSLYGATKLSSELLLTEYICNYNIKGIINRCGIIAGPWQFGKLDQGVFSLWMLNHYLKKPLTYIGWQGSGKQVRDLLHVEDLCLLIDLQIQDMDKGSGKIYNVGGGQGVSLSLLEATSLCQEITGNKVSIACTKQNRPFDIPVYITNYEKLNKDYSWKPLRPKEKILEDIYVWLKELKSYWK